MGLLRNRIALRGIALGAIALGGVALGAAACNTTADPAPKHKTPFDPNAFPSADDPGYPGADPPRPPDVVNEDSGAFGLGIGDRPNDGGRAPSDGGRPRSEDAAPPDDDASTDPPDAGPRDDDAGTPGKDSGTDAQPPPPPPPPDDAGPALCAGALAAGDLAVVELMIQTQAGSGDHGEWLEVQSTRDCTLNLNGLRITSPRGAGSDNVTIGSDMLLPPNGIFVVADAADAAVNHDLPGPVIVWDGAPADVLKNDGDSIAFTSAAGVAIETFTYPATTLQVGRSISFPADCAWSDRSDWKRWSFSSHVYSGALEGTPNADNSDVACF